MIILGIIALVVGLVLGISILFWIGVVLLVIGVLLLATGSFGHPVGGRRHYW